MKDLLRHWDHVTARLGEGPRACVLTDFDGTLTPLVDCPDAASLPDAARRAIEKIVENPYASFGVVSGRSLADLTRRVNVDGIWYVGNHGYEIRRPAGDVHCFYEPEEVRYLDLLREELERRTASIAGVGLEHKGPVLALHFRQVEPERVLEVEQAFLEAVDRLSHHLMMARGNRVLEARLRGNCNKGTAVRLIRRELPSRTLIFYFGDDVTDRDAFRELRRSGVSVQVGEETPCHADFTLRDPQAVVEALDRIDRELRTRRGPPAPKSASDPRYREG